MRPQNFQNPELAHLKCFRLWVSVAKLTGHMLLTTPYRMEGKKKEGQIWQLRGSSLCVASFCEILQKQETGTKKEVDKKNVQGGRGQPPRKPRGLKGSHAGSEKAHQIAMTARSRRANKACKCNAMPQKKCQETDTPKSCFEWEVFPNSTIMLDKDDST